MVQVHRTYANTCTLTNSISSNKLQTHICSRATHTHELHQVTSPSTSYYQKQIFIASNIITHALLKHIIKGVFSFITLHPTQVPIIQLPIHNFFVFHSNNLIIINSSTQLSLSKIRSTESMACFVICAPITLELLLYVKYNAKSCNSVLSTKHILKHCD